MPISLRQIQVRTQLGGREYSGWTGPVWTRLSLNWNLSKIPIFLPIGYKSPHQASYWNLGCLLLATICNKPSDDDQEPVVPTTAFVRDSMDSPEHQKYNYLGDIRRASTRNLIIQRLWIWDKRLWRSMSRCRTGDSDASPEIEQYLRWSRAGESYSVGRKSVINRGYIPVAIVSNPVDAGMSTNVNPAFLPPGESNFTLEMERYVLVGTSLTCVVYGMLCNYLFTYLSDHVYHLQAWHSCFISSVYIFFFCRKTRADGSTSYMPRSCCR